MTTRKRMNGQKGEGGGVYAACARAYETHSAQWIRYLL